MRFFVDELPYYQEPCPLANFCWNSENKKECPMFWDKYFVSSKDNPHCCTYLFEKGAKIEL